MRKTRADIARTYIRDYGGFPRLHSNHKELEKLKEKAVTPKAGERYALHQILVSENTLRIRTPMIVSVSHVTKHFAEWEQVCSGLKGKSHLTSKRFLCLFLPEK